MKKESVTSPASRRASDRGAWPRRRGTWGLTALALTVLIAGSAGVAAAADGAEGKASKTVVGSWIASVSPTIQPQFVSLGTFNEDGGFIATDSLAMGFPPESPGHGRWIKKGPNEFAVTFWTLLGDGSGNLAGTSKVRATITLSASGDEWSGVFQVDIFDAGGTFLFSDNGTVQATRIKVEPLP